MKGPFGRKSNPKMSIVDFRSPEMTPKFIPKWSQGNNGRPLRNMRRHGRSACSPPSGSSILAPVSKTPKISQTNTQDRGNSKTVLQNDLKKDYVGGAKISQNLHLRDLGLSWGPDGGLDSQNDRNYLQNVSRDTQISPKTMPKTILGWEARRL